MFRWSVLVGLTFTLLVSCSKKDVTQYMTSKEHFEYAMKFFHKKDYIKAQEQFSLITYKYSGSDIADDAQYYLGESYYRQSDWISASSEFERLASSYPKSNFLEEAMYKLALCYNELSPGFALDQKYTFETKSAVQNFIDLFPKSTHRDTINKIYDEIKFKQAKKHFESAKIYRKISEYEAAIVYYDHVITDYYDSPFVAEAKFWKGYCNYKLDEFQKARLILKRVIEDYPQNKVLVERSMALLEPPKTVAWWDVPSWWLFRDLSIKEKEEKAAAKAAKAAAAAAQEAQQTP